MRIKNLSCCIIFVLLSLNIFAQIIDKNSSPKDLNTFYNQHIGKSAVLYSGPAYVAQAFRMEGSPFHGSDTLTLGWIRYDDQYYKDVLLQWDVFQNYIVTQSLVSNAKVILRNELIDSFFYAGHLVKFLPADKKNNLMHEGFYDILYAGPTTLMARRKKIARDGQWNNKLVYHILDKSKYYIKKKGIYYLVSNRKDLARMFGKEMASIKKVVRGNELKWRKDFEQILVLAVVHYDQSNPGK